MMHANRAGSRTLSTLLVGLGSLLVGLIAGVLVAPWVSPGEPGVVAAVAVSPAPPPGTGLALVQGPFQDSQVLPAERESVLPPPREPEPERVHTPEPVPVLSAPPPLVHTRWLVTVGRANLRSAPTGQVALVWPLGTPLDLRARNGVGTWLRVADPMGGSGRYWIHSSLTSADALVCTLLPVETAPDTVPDVAQAVPLCS